jgi:hypothetical protein
MREWMLSMEAFAAWLCEREGQIVGVPGRLFGSPLAYWLEQTYGRVYGVNEQCCWLASDERQLFRLPLWTRLFILHSERVKPFEALTGDEAFTILACIEERMCASTYVMLSF